MQKIIARYLPLLYLLNCSLHQTQPDWSLLADADLDELEQLGRFHGVGAMAGSVIVEGHDGGLFTAEQKAQWKENYYHSVRDSLLVDREIDRVCGALSGACIGFVKLKGSVLRSCYPKRGMREMSDVDLLIDPKKREQAKAVMEELGYETEVFGKTNHDIYIKPPVYHFELHNQLFMELYADYIDYFRDSFEKLPPASGDGYEKKLSNEDFYLFMIAHACKHLHKGGIGLRVLTDIFVAERHFQLDRDRIDRELPKLGLVRDEMNLRSLSEKLFASPMTGMTCPALSKDEENLLTFMMKSGLRGSFEQHINNQAPQGVYADSHDLSKNKWHYIKNRLFMDPKTYRTKYPFFYRHKIARPFLPIVRLAKSAVKRDGKVKNELKRLRSVSPKDDD